MVQKLLAKNPRGLKLLCSVFAVGGGLMGCTLPGTDTEAQTVTPRVAQGRGKRLSGQKYIELRAVLVGAGNEKCLEPRGSLATLGGVAVMRWQGHTAGWEQRTGSDFPFSRPIFWALCFPGPRQGRCQHPEAKARLCPRLGLG